MDDRALLYCKLTIGSGELKSQVNKVRFTPIPTYPIHQNLGYGCLHTGLSGMFHNSNETYLYINFA